MSTLREPSEQAIAVADGTHGDEGHHVLPIGVYLKVYGGLLMLTYLTVHVSYMSLGSLSLPTAMLVALVKAGLVVGFFMHLKYDTRFNSLVFFSSILFIVIFFSFTMLDLTTRGAVAPDVSTFAYEHEQAEVARAREVEELGMVPVEAPAAETEPSAGDHE